MSLYFRPATFLPVRCAPAVFRYSTPSPTFYPVARDFFSLFDETFSQLEAVARQQQKSQQQTRFRRPFSPKFNVKEQDKTYLVEGELPGFDAKDISIEFLDEGHTLQIQGKTASESSSKPETTATTTPAVENVKAEQSEATSVKSHQATVEDVPESSDAPARAETGSTQEVIQTETAPAPAPTTEQPKNHIIERYTGTFTRTFRFADKVDQESVKASLKDGILAITLPFARKPESRRINIE